MSNLEMRLLVSDSQRHELLFITRELTAEAWKMNKRKKEWLQDVHILLK